MIKQIDLHVEGTAIFLFPCDKPFLHCAIQDISLYIPFMLENQESDFNYYFCYLKSMSNVINDQNKRCKSHADLSGSITMSFEVLEIRQGKELAAAK